MVGGNMDRVMTGRRSKRNDRVESERRIILMTGRGCKRNNRVEKKVIAGSRTGRYE